MIKLLATHPQWNYMILQDLGYSIEMKENSVNKFSYPSGEYWKNNLVRLKNKKIVVTAAAQGIGRATALAFAKEGANVIATDVNEEKLNEIKADYSNIQTYKLDSTNKLDVENFCSSISDINILFHAVGFVHHGAILD